MRTASYQIKFPLQSSQKMMVECTSEMDQTLWSQTPPFLPPPTVAKKTKKKCECCPYGYHIDLDFVRFCEVMDSKTAAPSSTLRERRRQRQSMEVLLGITSPVVWQLEQQVECENKLADKLEERTVAEKLTNMAREEKKTFSVSCRDALNKAVLDFEETYQMTNKNISLADVTELLHTVEDNIPEVPLHHSPSVSSLSSCSSDDMPLDIITNFYERASHRSQECDTISISSSVSGISTGALQVVREKVAKSLEKMKEMEENLKHIPLLRNEVNILKDEKRVLLLQLKAVEAEKNNLANSLVSANFKLANNELKQKTTNLLNNSDVSFDSTIFTRDVGVSHQYPKLRSTSTQVDMVKTSIESKPILVSPPVAKKPCRLSMDTLKPQFIAPECDKVSIKLVNKSTNTRYAKVKDCDTLTDLKMQQLYTESQLEEMLESHEKKIKRGEEALRAKLKVDKSVMAKPRMSDVSVLTRVKMKNVGVSDHSMQILHCDLCNVSKKNVGVCTTALITTPDHLVPQTMVRSKSSDHFSVRQKQRPVANKLTDTSDLIILENFERNTTHIQKGDSSVFTKDKSVSVMIEPPVIRSELAVPAQCKTCAERITATEKFESVSTLPSSSPRSPGTNQPSQIPRIARTKGQNPSAAKKPFNRQDTYTKIISDVTSQTIPENGSESVSASTNVEVKLAGPERSRELVSSTSTDNRSDEEGNQNLSSSADQLYIISTQKKNRKKVEPSKEMRGAMKVMSDSLKRSPHSELPTQLKAAVNIIQREWFQISSSSLANPLNVEDYLDSFEDYSSELLEHIVNMTDDSGNTAMHYAVSNGNFDVVSILLDSKVCNINQFNQAGYTSVMLVSLAEVQSETDSQVVQRLFQLADVNIRAKQHGQTALMLAASHGKYSMASMLLSAEADVNIQDDDGSTALMCAAEHGHIDMVKLLLSQDIDASITDHDGSTALNIAMEAGHRDVGVLLYAHQHFNSRSSSRTGSPFSTLKRKGK
ncbi:uncharacterized protein LOC132204282 [Neocloeon triangulifer]|uniref:uncharacterized protein LOC132204282 n=1 Tax=Neocloeon triangulifer TaxID=2078957 RepID=UPI00286EBCFE|nr:uncharacterized protein LOC132204282 [Neocloeon triangulifer]XP_059488668.1 uncharacterized protein LOC132204282 [Neocloeon triangulifer]XP_059488669.1 uncharacterized protein LOC132204282 [Neocloeon triangulifer]XP_059488670.1 uncharacterized protein LOC132204282 [Neocloeon triangulifer]